MIVASSLPGELATTRLAESCIGLLRDRGWAGDEELAEQLEAALHR